MYFLFNKKLLLVGLMVLMVVFFISGCSKSEEVSSLDKPIELNLAHFFPGTHPAETELIQVWAKEIKEATNGQVIIESYPNQTLLKAPDIYNGVVEGVADIGLSCFSYTRGRFPVLEVFELPGITYNNSKVAGMVAWEGIKQLNPEEVQDTKLLMVIATGPGDLATKDPIKSLDDLKGVEIRATGLSAKTIEVLGGIPIGMDQSEAYEALSKGIVKGNLIPLEVLKGWNQADVTKYVTKTPFLYNTLFFITMNLDKWNSIPKDLQDIILETTDKCYNDYGLGLWDKQNEVAIEWAVNEKGMEIFELSPEEAAKWVELVTPIQNDYINKMKEMNIDKDIIKIVKDLADKYNEIYK